MLLRLVLQFRSNGFNNGRLQIDSRYTGTNASFQLNGAVGARMDIGIANARKAVIYNDANNFLNFQEILIIQWYLKQILQKE